MLTIWIIHRDAGRRAALAGIAGAGDNTLLGHPSDELFASAQPADAVVLSLSGDFELELEFAHRMAPRLRDCVWILLAERRDLAESRRLFDTLPAELLAFPPTPAQLRRVLARGLRRRRVEPLSRRGDRGKLAGRFGRWFRDYETAPEIFRAFDPKLADVPLLIRGEPGTGRGLLARYLHSFGGSPETPLVHVACAGARSERDLLEQIATGTEAMGRGGALTLWLEDVDQLSPPLQQRLQDWIEYGLPEGLGAPAVRFIATAREDIGLDADPADDMPELDAGLSQALAGIAVVLAPLRERTGLIEGFVTETAELWCAEHGQRTRSFSSEAMEALCNHPWPGNLRELESVVHRTLAFSTADPLLAVHLRFEGATSRLDLREPTERSAPAPPPSEPSGEGPEAPLPETEALASYGALPNGAPQRRIPEPSRAREELVVAGELLGDEETIGVGLLDDEDAIGDEEAIGEVELIEAEPLADVSAPEPDWDSEIPAELDAEAILLEPDTTEASPFDAKATPESLTNVAEEPEAPAAQPSQVEPEPPAEPEPSAEAIASEPEAGTTDWPRLATAIAHEVRNPLVSIRTFSELLPQHYDDEEFRTRFAELVSADVRRIEQVMDRLQDVGELGQPRPRPLDMALLLSELLDERGDDLDEQMVELLTELDPDRSQVLSDPDQIRGAIEAILDRVVSTVEEGTELFVASGHHERGIGGGPMVRTVLRFHSPGVGLDAFAEDAPIDGLAPEQVDLAYVVGEAVVRAQGGSLTIDTTLPGETLIAIDLPAPS